MAKLENLVAIVTGAAAGIGRCTAELFVDEGAVVYACDVADIPYTHERVIPKKLDVTDRAACEALCADITGTQGKIDILINNAGITADALTFKMTDEQWDRVFDVNVRGIFNLVRYAGPAMQRAGSGAIVNVSSVVGEYGNIGQANYAATKSAIYGLTQTWAKEFSRKGEAVRVNCVSPGYTMTDILKTVPQDLLDKFAAQTMLKRLGQPDEIARCILFLASPDSSYITGHNLSVNGGMRL